MSSTTLKQMTDDERLNLWKPKISCKPAQNFVVFALKTSFFPLSTKMFRVICRSCKYFHHLPPHQFLFVCMSASES